MGCWEVDTAGVLTNVLKNTLTIPLTSGIKVDRIYKTRDQINVPERLPDFQEYVRVARAGNPNVSEETSKVSYIHGTLFASVC